MSIGSWKEWYSKSSKYDDYPMRPKTAYNPYYASQYQSRHTTSIQSWNRTRRASRSTYFKSSEPGKRGLDNIGNTCFMNAVLQCLVHISPLKHYFLSERFMKDIPTKWDRKKKDNIQLALVFRNLVNMMWSNTSHCTTIKPTAIKMLMGQLHDDYQGYEQRDSHEFLLRLIEEIGKGISYEVNINITGEPKSFADKLAIKAYERFRECNAKEYSELIRIFGGMYNNIIRRIGPTEKKLNCNFETFMSIEVPIPQHTHSGNQSVNSVTLMDCLEEYVEVEDIEGVTKADSIKKKISVWQLPMVLVICIKRFERNPYRNLIRKIDTNVKCPFRLDIGNYVSSPEQNNAKYELCGVTNHSGTPQMGHYTANCRVDDEWFYFNDNNIAKLEKDEVITDEAYILFYQRTHHIEA